MLRIAAVLTVFHGVSPALAEALGERPHGAVALEYVLCAAADIAVFPGVLRRASQQFNCERCNAAPLGDIHAVGAVLGRTEARAPRAAGFEAAHQPH